MQLNKKNIIFLGLVISLLIPRVINAQDTDNQKNKLNDGGLLRNFYCAFNWRKDSTCIDYRQSSLAQNGNNTLEESISIKSVQDLTGATILQVQTLKGDKGDRGDKGDTGDKGETGIQGLTGSQGIPGTAALKGDKGDPGASGGTGAKGDRGDKGDTGAQGPAGAAGESGISNTCSDGQILKWSDGQWSCSADAGGSSYTASGEGLELNVTQLSLELNGGSLSVSSSGLKIADTYDDNFTLTTGSYSNPSWITSLAGTKITGDISGNAGTVTNGIYTNTDFAGDVTGKYNLLTLANSGVTAGTYGDTGANLTQITVNSKGQITSASNRVLTKSNLGLGNVENTALSTWTGTGTLTTLGIVSSGTWHGSDIDLSTYTSGNYVASVSNGSGITGGSSGSEGATLTLSLDINGLTAQSGGVSDDDLVAVYDVSSSANRKLTRSQLLAGVTGALVYQGTWSATSNSPSLNDTTGVQGKYYVAEDDGSVDFDGAGERSSVAFTAGDWVVHNGTRWEKLDNANNVQSVFGRQGVVTSSSGDYTASQIGNTVSGNIGSSNVQDALNELDTEKQSLISAGTTGQYYRGDKSWQTLDKTAVGLSNVENTTLSTWTGSTNITTLGTIVSGTWNGADIALGTRTSGNYVAGATSLGGLTLTGTEGGTLGILLDGSTLSVGESGLKIADGLVSNWNTAYGWGNHASANYLTANSTATLTNKSGNISQWTNDTAYITDGNTNWNNSYSFITGLDISQVTNGSGVYFDYKPNNTACSSNQTLKYTVSTGWVCADDNNTTYTAGVGLTLNGTTLAVSDNYVLNTGDTINGDLIINGNVTINGNILPGANNTYNLGSTAAQWNEIFASTNTIYIGGIPLSNNDGTLQWNGSALGGGGGTTTIQSISTGTTITTWNRTIKADASTANATVILPTAVGNAGQLIEVYKTDTSTNFVKISASSGQTIDGITKDVYLYNQGESVVFRSDGSNILIASQNKNGDVATITNWQTGTFSIESTDTAPSGGTVTVNKMRWRRVGQNMEIEYDYNMSVAGNVGTGTYLLPIPSGYNIDTTNLVLQTEPSRSVPTQGATNIGYGYADYNATDQNRKTLTAYVWGGATQNKLSIANTEEDSENHYVVGSDWFENASRSFSLHVSIPIQGWSAMGTNVVSTVEYVKVNLTSDTDIAPSTSIVFNQTETGNIPYNSTNGQFTLKAGKTYLLNATVALTGSVGALDFQWRTTAGTLLGSTATAYGFNKSTVPAQAIFTPSTDTIVTVYITAEGDSAVMRGGYVQATIQQIGSVASTGVALNTLTGALASGSIDSQNFPQTWTWNTLTTESGLSLTSNSSSYNSTNGLFYVANTGSTNGVVARIQSLNVLSNGNVGIGTTGPGGKLTVDSAAASVPSIGLLRLGSTDYSGQTNNIMLSVAPGVVNVDAPGIVGGRFKIDASGNVGIGTTSPSQKFEISGGMLNILNSGTAPGMGPEFALGSVDGGYKWIQSYGSQALVLNPIGNNVGIGTTSPNHSLVVNRDSGEARVLINALSTSNSALTFGTGGANDWTIYRPSSSNDLRIAEDNVNNHVTFQAGGNVGIGTETPGHKLTVNGSTNNEYITQLINNGTTPHGLQVRLSSAVSGSNFVGFFNSTDSVGGISYNGTGVNYNQTSDQRLKENIVDTHYSVLDLMKINVRDFEYKSDSNNQTLNGFIAQELQKIYPEAVTIGTDEIDNNGNLVHPWMVDYGRLTPLIIKSIQDQQSEITSNTADITALDLRVEETEENLSQEKLTEIDNKIISLEDRLNQITDGAVTFKQNVEFQGPVVFKKIVEFIDKAVFKENVTLEKQLCFKKADGSEVCLNSDKVEKLMNLLPTETPIPTPTMVEPTPEVSITPSPIPESTITPTPETTASATPTETPINN